MDENMKPSEQKFYNEGAQYYDLLYSTKVDYEKEAAQVVELVAEFKKSPGNELLEVACGTGKHLEYLKANFACAGVDINEGIMREAVKRHPEISFQQADMVTMDLGKQFDVVTCLFSSIGYVKTLENLEKTMANFATHLKPGGVAVVVPWFSKEHYKPGMASMLTYDGDGIKIARLNISEVEGDLSVLNFHFLVAEDGKPVQHFTDRHELGMFSSEQYSEAMRKAGLDVTFRDGFLHRGAYIGIKQ